MGCCCSGEEEAKRTELPPPAFGQDLKVKLKKQGWFDADFDVLDLTTEKDDEGKEKPVGWMLLDAVGSLWDSEYNFFLKYRNKEQQESAVLGMANLQREHDYMYYDVQYSHCHRGCHPSTYSKKLRRWKDQKVVADFVIARRARLYSDREQQKLTGHLEAVTQGRYTRWRHVETWLEKRRYRDSDGNWHTTYNRRRTVSTYTRCCPKVPQYTLTAYDNVFNIAYDERASGKWFKADELTFLASHAQTGAPLFRVVSDGKKKAEVETFSHGDPVNSLLAAFTVAIKMDPKEFYGVCKQYCYDNIELASPIGLLGGFGLNDQAYNETFSTALMVKEMPPVGFTYGVEQLVPVAWPTAPTPNAPGVSSSPLGAPFRRVAAPPQHRRGPAAAPPLTRARRTLCLAA